MPNSGPQSQEEAPPPVYDTTNREASALSELHIALTHSIECLGWNHRIHCNNRRIHAALDDPNTNQSTRVWYNEEVWAVRNRGTLACWVADPGRLERLLRHHELSASSVIELLPRYGTTKPEDSLERFLNILRDPRPPTFADPAHPISPGPGSSSREPARITLEGWLTHPDRAEAGEMQWYPDQHDRLVERMKAQEDSPGLLSTIRKGKKGSLRPGLRKAPSTYDLRRKAVEAVAGPSTAGEGSSNLEEGKRGPEAELDQGGRMGGEGQGVVDARASRDTFETAPEQPPPAYDDTLHACDANGGQEDYTRPDTAYGGSDDRDDGWILSDARGEDASLAAPMSCVGHEGNGNTSVDRTGVPDWARVQARKPVPKKKPASLTVEQAHIDHDDPIRPASVDCWPSELPPGPPAGDNGQPFANACPSEDAENTPAVASIGPSGSDAGAADEADTLCSASPPILETAEASLKPPTAMPPRPTSHRSSTMSSSEAELTTPATRPTHALDDDRILTFEPRDAEVLEVLPPDTEYTDPADLLEPPSEASTWSWKQSLMVASSFAAAVGLGYLYHRHRSSGNTGVKEWGGKALGALRTGRGTWGHPRCGIVGSQVDLGSSTMSTPMPGVVGVVARSNITLTNVLPFPD